MTSIPRSLQYKLLSQAAPCRSYTTKFYADNGQSFTEGQSTWITIPCGGQNQYMNPDVRLTFSVSNTSDALFTMDGTVNSAIAKLEIYSGANLLASYNEYNVLFSMLYDCQCPASNRATLGKCMGVNGTATYGGDGPTGPAAHFCGVRTSGGSPTQRRGSS